MKSEFSFFRGNFSIVAVDFFFLEKDPSPIEKKYCLFEIVRKVVILVAVESGSQVSVRFMVRDEDEMFIRVLPSFR